MILTDAQVKRFWREWSAACKAQGWTRAAGISAAEIDRRRRELIQRAGFESLTHVDRGAGFGRVLAELGILRTKIAAAIERIDPAKDSARRKRWVLRQRILPCLSVYVSDADSYLSSILRDKFDWRRVASGYAVPLTLDDLTDDPVIRARPDGSIQEQPSELDQIMMTLNRQLHAYRRKAGHSVHDMTVEAGIQCSCARCAKAAKQGPRHPAAAVAAAAPF